MRFVVDTTRRVRARLPVLSARANVGGNNENYKLPTCRAIEGLGMTEMTSQSIWPSVESVYSKTTVNDNKIPHPQ